MTGTVSLGPPDLAAEMSFNEGAGQCRGTPDDPRVAVPPALNTVESVH